MVFADSKNILDKDPTETQKFFFIFLCIPVDRLAQFATREDTPGIPEEIQLFQIFSDEISSIIR